MKRSKTLKWEITLFTLMCLLVFGYSCDNNGTEPEDQSPDVPPISTFLIDFDAFPGISAQPSHADQYASLANWGWAGINILLWNTVITVHAVVPVAAYFESFKHTPVKQEDGSWMWSYDVIVDEDTYTARLYASTGENSINWSMYLSKVGDFSDFLWFSGEHDLLYTEGSWTLYKDPADPVQYIGIDWHRDLQNATEDIKYTNIEPENPGNGGYITYGVTDDPEYDAYYDIFIAEQDHDIDIEWNLDSRSGRVMDKTHFGDALWHCWSEILEDVDCGDE